MNSHDRLLTETLSALVNSIERHAPGSVYGKFCAWCLHDQNPQRKLFLQVLGIYQLVNLTTKLFENLLSEEEWEILLPYCAVLNAYLTCEAVSDNLAIGLARPKSKDGQASQRRQVLQTFNQATIERLRGTIPAANHLLSPVERLTRQISMFKSSLSPQKLIYLATSSVKDLRRWSLQDLNTSLQAVLVANAETCCEVGQTLEGFAGATIVSAGLIDRYESVNRLLSNEKLTRSERVHVGTHAVLVLPTIGYYITVLANQVRPRPTFETLVANGTVATALYDAALLVRLLNDLGTPLLTMQAPERQTLMQEFRIFWQTHFLPTHSIFEVLAKFSETCVALTRIRKDTMFGEYNLALDLLPPTGGITEGLNALEENLNYYSELYGRHYKRLEKMTIQMTECLEDDLVSKVIWQFVNFHEWLYSNSFASNTGEYAV